MPQPSPAADDTVTGVPESALANIDALKSFLEEHGVSASQFGYGQAKPLSFLLKELKDEASHLELQRGFESSKPKLLRVVQPVIAYLRWRGHVLVKESQHFPDGRIRVRKGLLSGKKEPRDGSVFSTLLRTIETELGLAPEAIRREGVLTYRADSYHFEVEHLLSPSFPGLPTVYRTHRVQIDICDDAEVFRDCGLPDCAAFSTTVASELGTTTHKWNWYPASSILKARIENLNESHLPRTSPSRSSVTADNHSKPHLATLTKQDIPDADALNDYLQKAGIDTSTYGQGKAKTVASLFSEFQNGETSLQWDDSTGTIRRVVEPLFIQLVFNGKVLVEREQRLADGRIRQRNMLLAEKKSPEDSSVAAGAVRGVQEELNLFEHVSDVDKAYHFVKEAYCCCVEKLESSSFPGLPCVYITHYCVLQLLDDGAKLLEALGMLKDEFDTQEKDKKVNCWIWRNHEEARRSNVKGFPQLGKALDKPKSHHVYTPIEVPKDVQALKSVLEAGQVDTSAWGAYMEESLSSLMGELLSGASKLEKEVNTGALRRVVTCSMLQITVNESEEPKTDTLVKFRQSVQRWEVWHQDFTSFPGLPSCHQTQVLQLEEKLTSQVAAPSETGPLPTLLLKDGGKMKDLDGEAVEVPVMPESLQVRPSKSANLRKQFGYLKTDLKFQMVANESEESAQPAAEHAVKISCEILLVRNINPLTATFHCRFVVFLDWIDQAATQMPAGTCTEDNHKKLNIPEIALQNTLKTALEVYSTPKVLDPHKGHVTCQVLYQAMMQMELNMRLFPFDKQQLGLVLGLRARRDRNRGLFCVNQAGSAFSQSCKIDASLDLNEWNIVGSYSLCDRPDGRARVQFGVEIARQYKYYLVNVLFMLSFIAAMSFAGYTLDATYDRLRSGIAVLFAQTTFRLSVDSKLPKVAYATVFDNFAMACQILALVTISGNLLVAMISQGLLPFVDPDSAEVVDHNFGLAVAAAWGLTNIALVCMVVFKRACRRSHGSSQLDDDDQFGITAHGQKDVLERAQSQYRSSARDVRPVDAVALHTHVWLIHDISPNPAQYDCKFTVYMEWLAENAKGLKKGQQLTKEEVADLKLDPPELDIRNKVEMIPEDEPTWFVANPDTGHVVQVLRVHAKLQLQLNLRRFPFDCQHLPIEFIMPNKKDRHRAFVYRSGKMSLMARGLDEYSVLADFKSDNIIDGQPVARYEIVIRRNAKYYVLSIMIVVLGIGSLMFSVFAIDAEKEESGFVDQGKVLAQLLMTLLAFKLLTSSGKIPKVPYATMFDSYALFNEVCFFVITGSCIVRRILSMDPARAAIAPKFRLYACLTLLSCWLIFNLRIAIQAYLSVKEEAKQEHANKDDEPISEQYHQQVATLMSTPMLTSGDGFVKSASPVLLDIMVQKMHSLNAETATFVCEFEVNLAWLCDAAKDCPEGAVNEKQLRLLEQPRLCVLNALTSKFTFQEGQVVKPSSGHVSCKLKVRAQVQMNLDLTNFPWDEQSLKVVLAMEEPQDLSRRFVLQTCRSDSVVKTGEWSELRSFASTVQIEGFSEAAFGVRIRRFSRYYVTSLASCCLWSLFIFSVYAFEVEQFSVRIKLSVGVLLVQNVSKIAVSMKLPRVVRMTAYDRVALNSLLLNFGVAISAAIFCMLGQLQLQSLSSELLASIDQATGVVFAILWLLMNIHVAADVYRSRHQDVNEDTEELPKELSNDLEMLQAARPSPEVVLADFTEEACEVQAGIKLQMVSSIDVGSATFEGKFHVFMDWKDPRALRHSSKRMSVTEAERQGIRVPKLKLANAISTMVEEVSDLVIVSAQDGHVACRIQCEAKFHNNFLLKSFPFDCQRLEIVLELAPGQSMLLRPAFCLNDKQEILDGWKRISTSIQETRSPDDGKSLSLSVLVERESQFYVFNVFLIFLFLTTIAFSFFTLDSSAKLIDTLKIGLTQVTFRFTIEHRLPKTQQWTPFDIYVTSCQIMTCLVLTTFIAASKYSPEDVCSTRNFQSSSFLSLAILWAVWNLGFVVYAVCVQRKEKHRCLAADGDDNIVEPVSLQNLDPQKIDTRKRRMRSRLENETTDDQDGGMASMWKEQHGREGESQTQLVSIAMRIWLVRNVDLVNATFECKFRLFLEWFDDQAVGQAKGKKTKLPVPKLSITNAVVSEVLDRSTAPEVVNSETGHLAAQILYRATLRMDQMVHLFPFDCQWLAITVSLQDDGTDKSKALLFQYCEVDKQLSLDEWFISPQPAFCSLSKRHSASMQHTVMGGILIRRSSRYYVANIMLVLGLISSLTFSVYTLQVDWFFERAEVFLGIFPLIVTFKMSAQGKLPRVSYSTNFDRYARACQVLFVAIVVGSMTASFCVSIPSWLRPCTQGFDEQSEWNAMLREWEYNIFLVLLVLWFAWNARFAWSAYKTQRLQTIKALRTQMPVVLQDMDTVLHGGAGQQQLLAQLEETARRDWRGSTRSVF